jgi:hypothetical protein
LNEEEVMREEDDNKRFEVVEDHAPRKREEQKNKIGI